MPRRRKRARYYEEWLSEHRRVVLYLNKDEYALLSSLADIEGLTIKDYVVKTIKGLVEFGKRLEEKFREGYAKGLEEGLKIGYEKGRMSVLGQVIREEVEA